MVKKTVYFQVFLLLFIILNNVFAEEITVTGSGNCQVGERDTKEFVRNMAIQRAKLDASEKTKVAIINLTRVKNFEVEEDEIFACTGGILQRIGKPKIDDWNGKVYIYEAIYKVNSDIVFDLVKKMRMDNEAQKELKKIGKNIESLAKKNDNIDNLSARIDSLDKKRLAIINTLGDPQKTFKDAGWKY